MMETSIVILPPSDVYHQNPDKSKQYLSVSDLCALNPCCDELEERLQFDMKNVFSRFFSKMAGDSINYCHVFAGLLKHFTLKYIYIA